MRVLHILSQTELTGSEAYAQNLIQDQRLRGHTLWVASDKFHLDFSSATTLNLPISSSRFFVRWRNIYSLIQLVQSERIDIVHAHSRAACRHSRWISWLTKTPVISTIHGYQHDSWSKRLFNIWGQTVIAICEKIQQQLVNKFGAKPEDVKILRNPIGLPSKTIASFENRNLVLISGRASGPKGRRLTELFTSECGRWLDISSEQFEVHLYLTGLDAKESSKLLSHIPEAKKHRVVVSGEFVDLPSLYQKARVVVASGRIAIEALTHGAEVLALGESEFTGPVNSANLKTHLENNFGDVGPEKILDPQAVTHEFKKILKSTLSLSEYEARLKILSSEFDPQKIFSALNELTLGTRLYYKTRWIPILMYHRIPDAEIPTQHRTFVTKENFEKHLLFFSSQGFTTLTFGELYDFWRGQKNIQEFPRKPLILTFDDGYKDNLTNAQPLLTKYGFKANLFLLSDPQITQNNWDSQEVVKSELLSPTDRKNLDPAVFHICSHGLSHLDMRALPSCDALSFLVNSKEQLESEFGQKIVAFAPPYGFTNSEIANLAKTAGYAFVVNTDQGELRWTDNRFSLFRVNVFPEESWFSLWKKTSPWYRRYYYKKRGH